MHNVLVLKSQIAILLELFDDFNNDDIMIIFDDFSKTMTHYLYLAIAMFIRYGSVLACFCLYLANRNFH